MSGLEEALRRHVLAPGSAAAGALGLSGGAQGASLPHRPCGRGNWPVALGEHGRQQPAEQDGARRGVASCLQDLRVATGVSSGMLKTSATSYATQATSAPGRQRGHTWPPCARPMRV